MITVRIYPFFILVVLGLVSCKEPQTQEKKVTSFQNGDLVFSHLAIPQLKSLALLSKSDYKHVGVVFIQADTVFVYEAAGSVGLMPFSNWVAKNKLDSTLVLKRLKKEYQQEFLSKKLIDEGQKYLANYRDIIFNWSDSMMYGPELVWKMYQRGAGITLCPTKKMKEWDHANVYVLGRLKQKYEIEHPFILEDTVVSVDDIFTSEKLEEVYSGSYKKLVY